MKYTRTLKIKLYHLKRISFAGVELDGLKESEYRILNKIGKGIYSEVYKGEYNNKFYALKIFKNERFFTKAGRAEVEFLYPIGIDNPETICL